MNFHKTIGFLATLLLTLGLGVPDSFAQQTLSISVNPSSLTDTDNPTIVTVTADVAGGEEGPVTVTLEHNDGHAEDTAEGTDDFPTVTISSISITLDANGEGSGTSIFAFDPQIDEDPDDEVIVIQGAVGGAIDIAKIFITDVDPGVETVALTITPTSFADDVGTQNLEVSATITMEAAAEANTTVTVNINDITPAGTGPNDLSPDDYDAAVHAESDDYAYPTTPTITLIVPEGASSASGSAIVSITGITDAGGDSADEKVLVQAEAGGKTSTAVTLTMTDADVGIKTLALAVDPKSIKDTASETTVTLTATVTLETKVDVETTVTLAVTQEGSGGHSVSIDAPSEVIIEANDNNGKADVDITVTPQDSDGGTAGVQSDSNFDTEVVTFTGTATTLDLFTATETVEFSIEETGNGIASVAISSTVESLDDVDNSTNVPVTADVTLRANATTSTTVTVTLGLGDADDGRTADPADPTGASEDYAAITFSPIVIIIPTDSKSGTGSGGFTIDPIEDTDTDNEVVAITGSAKGSTATGITDQEAVLADPLLITINDATPSGGLRLDVEPDSFSEADGSMTVTITASIELRNRVDADTDVTVSLALDDENDDHTAESGDYGISTLPDIVVTILSGEKVGSEKGLFTLDPVVDADTDEDVIVIKGTATVGTTDLSDTETLSITDGVDVLAKNAQDADGFRVEITKTLGNNGWVKVGKETVQIRVYRRNIVASEWGNFTSIRVGLHPEDKDGDADTDDTAVANEVYALEVRDGSEQLSDLSLASVKTDSLGASDFEGVGTEAGSFPAKGKTNNIIAYQRQSEVHDYLEFRFAIADAKEKEDDLKKVFAVVTFKVETEEVGKLDSRDMETTIYPENPSLFPNEVVGDGKFIQIDRSKPLDSVVTAFTTTIRKGKADAQDAALTVHAGIGAWIKSTATYGDFNHHSVKFQLVGTEDYFVNDEDGNAVKVVAKNQALQGFPSGTKTSVLFDALTVFGSDGSLIDSVQVSENQFERKYNVSADPDESKARFKKNDWFEDDNVKVLIRAQVLDKAGNATTQTKTSAVFVLDSKPPKVTITYPKPSAPGSSRFTAGTSQEYEFLGGGTSTQDLKPLKFKTDEGTSLAWVVIGGIGTDADTLVASASADGAEATIAIGDLGLKNPQQKAKPDKANKHPKADAGAGGSDVDLTVVVKDMAGNKGSGTPDGQAILDSKAPKVEGLFPSNEHLEGYDNKIGGPEDTEHPRFSVNEAVDSILVRYQSSFRGLSKVGTDAQLSMAQDGVKIEFVDKDSLRNGETYELQVYVRDLASNVGVSGLQTGLVLDNNFNNPAGGGFVIASEVRDNTMAKDEQGADAYAKMDSVVAGQPVRLTITAIDTMLTRQSGETRAAITYSNDGVKVVAMDIDGNLISDVSFWGAGVTDNENGSATLNSDGWAVGSRKVFAVSTLADTITFAAKDLTAEGVVNFKATKGVEVDAADFAKLELTAWEDGLSVSQVWDVFGLSMVPTDKHGNPSLKTFVDQEPGTAKADSLNILDTRLKNDGNSALNYGDGVDIQLQATPPLGGLLSEVWGVGTLGHSLSVTAPNSPGLTLTVQARVRSSSLEDNDDRSENNRGSLSLTIHQPVEISITLWVLGQDGDQADNTVTTPAGGESIDVTARAEGLNEGDVVTFSTLLVSVDVPANADGHAPYKVPLSGSGAVKVTATSGQYSASLDVVYEEAPPEEGRKAHFDANGDPVYLIAKSSGTVGADDLLALLAAFDEYNVQADLDGDGDVDVDDFLKFIMSWGRTAVGPSTKPIVLLPGVNENVEFALSLGSERVVAGELMAIDVSLANVAALMGYGFTLNYETDKFEFVSVASADEDLLTSTGGETLFHHVAGDGQVEVATGMYNGTAVSGGGDIVRFVFRVLREFEDNARFEIADGLVFDPSQLSNPAVVAGVLELQSTPREFALHQNFPNPFNPDTTIKYDLAESADVTLQIYNVLGQVVRTLVGSEAQNAGRYQIRWNGMDDRGVSVSSGIYFYQISAEGKFQNVRKLMLLK